MTIGISDNKLKHCVEVARVMHELIKVRHPGEYGDLLAQDMFILGLLHDIGYEYTNDREVHNKVGGLILRRQDYKYWREIYKHGEANSDYDSSALRILNTADLLVDSKGNRVGVEERLEGIKGKYGVSSKQYNGACKLAKKIDLL